MVDGERGELAHSRNPFVVQRDFGVDKCVSPRFGVDTGVSPGAGQVDGQRKELAGVVDRLRATHRGAVYLNINI